MKKMKKITDFSAFDYLPIVEEKAQVVVEDTPVTDEGVETPTVMIYFQDSSTNFEWATETQTELTSFSGQQGLIENFYVVDEGNFQFTLDDKGDMVTSLDPNAIISVDVKNDATLVSAGGGEIVATLADNLDINVDLSFNKSSTIVVENFNDGDSTSFLALEEGEITTEFVGNDTEVYLAGEKVVTFKNYHLDDFSVI
jgi:hypothetical protein